MKVSKEVEIPLLKCQGCASTFSDDCIPKNLSCGHTLCASCADLLIANDKHCIECREKQKISSSADFTINYQLLRVRRSFGKNEISFNTDKKTLLSAVVSQFHFSHYLWMCGAHKSPNIFLCCSCRVWICGNCLVIDHPSLPRGSCRVIQLSTAMDQIKMKYKEVSFHILKELQTMKDNFDLETGMHDFCLKYCEKNRSHLRLVAEMEPPLLEKRKDNNEEVEKAKELLKKLEESFHAADSPEEIMASCKELLTFQEDSNNVIKQENEKLSSIRPSLVDHFRMEVKKIAEGKEQLYAALQENERFRWSRVTVEGNGRLLLYCLEEGTPPSNGITIPYKYMEMLLADSRKCVFYEVDADGETLAGRVFVKFRDENPLTDQMFLMCSGKKGVTYRHTRFFQNEKGRVSGGEYLRSDGSAGGTIVEGLGNCSSTTVYSRSKGIVMGDRLSTKFHFVLQSENQYHNDTLGTVTEGLDVLKAVANLEPVSKAYIKNCGIFIPMKKPD